MLSDRCGRTTRYLRLSITPACGMRCVYCWPVGVSGRPPDDLLTPAEIEGLVRHLVNRHGLRKVRLTGGEPTVRSDLIEIIRRLASIEGLRDIAMTTNGLTLARQARRYAHAGLDRVNVSLDSLNPGRFHRITGVDGLHHVLAGIAEARRAGLKPIKLNTVVVRGENERELPDLARFAASHGMEIRFIELMPMGPLAPRWADRYVAESEMRALLRPAVASWRALPATSASARGQRVTLSNGDTATIGFITPMSCHFCAACDRIRIAADATLFPCLMDRPSGSLLSALRPRLDADHLDELLQAALDAKRPEHPATGAAVMQHIGG